MNGEQLLLLIVSWEKIVDPLSSDCLNSEEKPTSAGHPPEDCCMLHEIRENPDMVGGTSKLRGELLNELRKRVRGNLIHVMLEMVPMKFVPNSVEKIDEGLCSMRVEFPG